MAMLPVCQTIRVCCKIANLVNAVSNSPPESSEERERLIQKIGFVRNALLVGLESCSLGCRVLDASEKIQIFKAGEFATHWVTLPLIFALNSKNKKLKTMESTLAGLLSMARSFKEWESSAALKGGEWEPKEDSLREMPCYSSSNATDCTNLAVAEAALNMNAASNSVELIEKMGEAYFDPKTECVEEFNLLALDLIPVYLHKDPILSKYSCPITRQPIRYPVGDPNRRTVYERAAIVEWVREHGSSPVTRQSLSEEQLVPLPAIQSLIDNRLKKLGELLKIAAEKKRSREEGKE